MSHQPTDTAEVQPEISFNVSRATASVIRQIAARAMGLEGLRNEDRVERCGNTGRLRRVRVTPLDIQMDVTATHCNGNPLRLDDLLAADDFNFAHDIYGIRRHLNRGTGKLENCFSPRFSARSA